MGKYNNKTKQKQNWRNGMKKYKKNSRSLLSDYKIWLQQRLQINKKLTIYKTNVKSVLIYNYVTWIFTKAQIEKVYRAHRKRSTQNRYKETAWKCQSASK